MLSNYHNQEKGEDRLNDLLNTIADKLKHIPQSELELLLNEACENARYQRAG